MKSAERKLSRRTFLATVGAGGASAAVALVSKENEPGTTEAAKHDAPRGYRLTEHVQNYYRTTKV